MGKLIYSMITSLDGGAQPVDSAEDPVIPIGIAGLNVLVEPSTAGAMDPA